MTQKIRKAPKGAKPTNPKYTLTLTKPQLDALRYILQDRYIAALMDDVPLGKAATNLYYKVKFMGRPERTRNDPS